MNLAITDIYRILRNAVKYFPATSPVRPCFQLQAFRVLQREPRTNSEVGTDNMGAVPTDKDSAFFWSRKWDLAKYNPNKLAYDYPVLTAFEISNDATGDVFQGQVQRSYMIELAVLDVFRPDCMKVGATPCEGRSINQIFLDTEVLLDSALKYLGGSVIATTNVDPVDKIYYLPFLEAAVVAGDIASFTVKNNIGLLFGADNRSLRFVRVEYPVKNIYGTKVQVKFKVNNCPTVNYAEVAPELAIVGFEIGCQNC